MLSINDNIKKKHTHTHVHTTHTHTHMYTPHSHTHTCTHHTHTHKHVHTTPHTHTHPHIHTHTYIHTHPLTHPSICKFSWQQATYMEGNPGLHKFQELGKLLLWLNFVLQCPIILNFSMQLASHHTCGTQNFEVAFRFFENFSIPKRIYSKHYFTTVSTWELMKSAQTKWFMPEYSLKGELNMN
jgi:hypothetical protein